MEKHDYTAAAAAYRDAAAFPAALKKMRPSSKANRDAHRAVRTAAAGYGKEVEQAKQSLEAAVASAKAKLAEGEQAAASQNWDGALESFRAGLAVKGTGDAELTKQLEAGQESAAAALRQRDQARAAAAELLAAADAALSSRNFGAAVESLRNGLELDLQSAELSDQLQAKLGDAEAGLAAQRAARVQGEEHVSTGDQCMETKNYVGAVEAYDAAVALDVNDAQLTERYQAAAAKARQAHADALSAAQLKLEEGRRRADALEWEAAIELFRAGVAIEGTDDQSLTAQLRSGQESAQEELQARDSARDEAASLLESGKSALSARAYDRAVESLRPAALLDVQSAELSGRVQTALDQAEAGLRAQESARTDAKAHVEAGAACMESRDYVDAIEEFTSALDLDVNEANSTASLHEVAPDLELAQDRLPIARILAKYARLMTGNTHADEIQAALDDPGFGVQHRTHSEPLVVAALRALRERLGTVREAERETEALQKLLRNPKSTMDAIESALQRSPHSYSDELARLKREEEAQAAADAAAEEAGEEMTATLARKQLSNAIGLRLEGELQDLARSDIEEMRASIKRQMASQLGISVDMIPDNAITFCEGSIIPMIDIDLIRAVNPTVSIPEARIARAREAVREGTVEVEVRGTVQQAAAGGLEDLGDRKREKAVSLLEARRVSAVQVHCEQVREEVRADVQARLRVPAPEPEGDDATPTWLDEARSALQRTLAERRAELKQWRDRLVELASKPVGKPSPLPQAEEALEELSHANEEIVRLVAKEKRRLEEFVILAAKEGVMRLTEVHRVSPVSIHTDTAPMFSLVTELEEVSHSEVFSARQRLEMRAEEIESQKTQVAQLKQRLVKLAGDAKAGVAGGRVEDVEAALDEYVRAPEEWRRALARDRSRLRAYYIHASQEVADTLLDFIERNDPEDLPMIEDALRACESYKQVLIQTARRQLVEHRDHLGAMRKAAALQEEFRLEAAKRVAAEARYDQAREEREQLEAQLQALQAGVQISFGTPSSAPGGASRSVVQSASSRDEEDRRGFARERQRRQTELCMICHKEVRAPPPLQGTATPGANSAPPCRWRWQSTTSTRKRVWSSLSTSFRVAVRRHARSQAPGVHSSRRRRGGVCLATKTATEEAEPERSSCWRSTRRSTGTLWMDWTGRGARAPRRARPRGIPLVEERPMPCRRLGGERGQGISWGGARAPAGSWRPRRARCTRVPARGTGSMGGGPRGRMAGSLHGGGRAKRRGPGRPQPREAGGGGRPPRGPRNFNAQPRIVPHTLPPSPHCYE